MKISIIISILSAFSVAYILAYIIGDMGYRSSEVIRCTKERKIVFKRPYWPIISKYDITTGLEIYVGGLLKSGNLSISGNPFRYAKEKIFSAGAQTIEISRSLLGEWYDDSLIINIKPDDRAFCALRVVYKFKGI